eukprot:Protomagalhaensia_sp_Gyna_25__5243@NODE_63_length_5749_cov_361_425919_g46_i0_p4_GENE_NODE_63_length_5749_cov_361_425919_g46_i0NODE_63_length_5749_cov_361_425919_g46_i0_p4_ORF_typecomplete_len219_score38_64IMCp/PF12314_8/0_72IMCp/PF12314_8/1_8e04_NODE_63_length_5749_cov_361_425919_g46_i015312187
MGSQGPHDRQESRTFMSDEDKPKPKSNRPVVVEKIIQQPTYVEKIVEVPVIKYVDVHREVIQYVPKVEVKVVEQEVPVPGPIIEVPRTVIKEVEKTVFEYTDTERQTTVACTVRPHVEESAKHKKVVRVKKYVPCIHPVDVYIPVPVRRELIPGETLEKTRIVQMPPSQFNAQVKTANPGLAEEHLTSLYQKYPDGAIPMFKGPGTAQVPPNIPATTE